MEKRKVQMGSTYLYSGYRKRRQSWGSSPSTSASLLSSHPALSQGEGLSLWGGHEPTCLPVLYLLFHVQENGQDRLQFRTRHSPFPPVPAQGTELKGLLDTICSNIPIYRW